MGIIIQAVTALVAAIVGQLDTLIATSVLFMAIAYLATSASIFSLRRKGNTAQFNLRGGFIVPLLGIAFSAYLITMCTLFQLVLGLVLVMIGIPIYIKYSSKKELAELKSELLSRRHVLQKAYNQEERFLAHALRHVKRLYRRFRRKKQT